jgi:hypothetical protein
MVMELMEEIAAKHGAIRSRWDGTTLPKIPAAP